MVGPRRRHAGYIPNADTIHPALSLDRVLHYTAALRGAGDHDGAAAEVLRAVDLAGRSAARVGELDAGQRKRAAIAVELLAEPSQLFLEEPTIGLDPAQGTEVMRRLRQLCESGLTVVLTTQNPLDAVRCDKVAVLATGGHLAFFGTPDAACEYFAADSLDEIYERLAGLGDPAAAWSRRFPQFSRTVPGFTATPTVPPLPGRPVCCPTPRARTRQAACPTARTWACSTTGSPRTTWTMTWMPISIRRLDVGSDVGLEVGLSGGEPALASGRRKPPGGRGGRVGDPPVRAMGGAHQAER